MLLLLLLLQLLSHSSITCTFRNFREVEVDIIAVTSKFQNACSNLSEAMCFMSSLEKRKDLINHVFLAAEAECAAVSSSSAPTSAPAEAQSITPANVLNAISETDANARAFSASTAPVARVNIDHVHIVQASVAPARFSSALILVRQVPEVWKVLRRDITEQVGASFKMIRGRGAVAALLITIWMIMDDCYCHCDLDGDNHAHLQHPFTLRTATITAIALTPPAACFTRSITLATRSDKDLRSCS